jgi:ABC-type phosphate transport system permease subunit
MLVLTPMQTLAVTMVFSGNQAVRSMMLSTSITTTTTTITATVAQQTVTAQGALLTFFSEWPPMHAIAS